jgi:hypothetical protein
MTVQNTQQNQSDSGSNHVIIVPHIEEDIILPSSASEAMPNLSVAEEINMRAKTIKLVSDLKGENIEPTEENVAEARKLASEMMTNPDLRPEFGNYPNETLAFLAGLVAQSNHMIVKDLADFKLYVVNSLVKMAETAKSDKDKIAALKSIGDIDGVDAFKKKTEVIHKMETMEEVEKELLSMLSELKQKALIKPKAETIDAEIVEDVRDETNTDEIKNGRI